MGLIRACQATIHHSFHTPRSTLDNPRPPLLKLHRLVSKSVRIRTFMKTSYITVEEMAEIAAVAPNTIYRILRADQHKDPDKRRIPGAYKRGSKYRGEWLIPRETALNWKRDDRGRKSVKSTNGNHRNSHS